MPARILRNAASHSLAGFAQPGSDTASSLYPQSSSGCASTTSRGSTSTVRPPIRAVRCPSCVPAEASRASTASSGFPCSSLSCTRSTSTPAGKIGARYIVRLISTAPWFDTALHGRNHILEFDGADLRLSGRDAFAAQPHVDGPPVFDQPSLIIHLRRRKTGRRELSADRRRRSGGSRAAISTSARVM